MRIGFLGLGTMGAPMARNLLRAGHAVVVWNRSPGRCASLCTAGATQAASPREAAQGAELIITMLADEAALEAVLAGDEGLLRGLEPGALVVEMSTIGPRAARAAAVQVNARGARFVDAPVSGTRAPAEAGKLLILAGGDAADVEAARPALLALGTLRHVGAIGEGAAMKLCLNALGAQMLNALTSVLGLAERQGLSRSMLLEVIQAGAFSSPLYELKRPRLLGEAPGAEPDFTIRLWDKDQRLVLEEAARLGYPMPMLEVVRGVLARAMAAGLGDEDIATVQQLYT